MLNITLSGGNLVATTTNNGAVRCLAGVTSGKIYWEVTATLWVQNSTCVGLGLATTSLANFWNATANCIAMNRGGQIFNNGSIGPSIGGTLATGAIVCFALDVTNKLLWMRNGAAGNWNGSGTANPATGVGGISLAAWASSALYAMAGGIGGSDAWTANFGASAFSGAVPSGFTAGWPTISAPPVDLAGNLGGISSYGKLSYGLKQYSRVAAFAPTFGADLTVSAGVALSGDLAPTVSFGANFGIVFGVSGDLVPAISFGADLDVIGFVDLSGDLAPQIALGGSLSLLVPLDSLLGSFGFTVVYGAAEMLSGPLWADSEPCPSPPWAPSEPCPPSLWTPIGPCDPVEWEKSELCNG